MRRPAVAVFAFAIALVAATVAAKSRAVRGAAPALTLSATRSFEITDKSIVSAFTLDRVLTQLVARSGVAGMTPRQLIRQLFDTQNPRPGMADPSGPHCDDTIVDGVPSFNGFPRRCPTPEGALAATPFLADEYYALAVVNRFDMTPPDGAHCGQYRIVFSRRETDRAKRVHFIFEPVLPNPNPSAGLAACRPVAQFWADLSAVDSMDERRARLERFFFEGLPGFPPVLDPAHLRGLGGIRTLQSAPTSASIRFYQFRLEKDCSAGPCTLRLMPDVLENQTLGRFFNANTDTPIAKKFREEFLRQVPALAVRTLNFSMNLPREFLMAESNPLDSEPAFIYDGAFNIARGTPAGAAFKQQIQDELTKIGSTLRPEDIVTRADQQNCVGCHVFNRLDLGEGVTLGPGFSTTQMITEDVLMDGEGGPESRFGVNPVVEKQFIPSRMQILIDFLKNGTPPKHSN